MQYSNISSSRPPCPTAAVGHSSPWVWGKRARSLFCFSSCERPRMQSVVKQFLPPLHSAHRTISRVYSPASKGNREPKRPEVNNRRPHFKSAGMIQHKSVNIDKKKIDIKIRNTHRSQSLCFWLLGTNKGFYN